MLSQKNPLIITMTITGSLGIIVSIIATVAAGSGIPSVVLGPLASGVIMAILGGAAYFVVDWQIPELLESHDDDLENDSSDQIDDVSGHEDTQESQESQEDQEDQEDSGVGSDLTDESDEKYVDSLSGEYPKAASKKKIAGNQIEVEGVALPNQPDLMAKAVQHVLDSDREEGSGPKETF